MPTPLTITAGPLKLSAELNDLPTAKALLSLLPLEISMSRWGDEYYGDCGINVQPSQDAREVMEIGELAVWPVGNALCIFFGPTPASQGNEPRAASPVNPVGRLLDDPQPLRALGRTIQLRIEISG
ncbi:MAG: hypothetical protein HWN51_00795 [Desulfobacterales bacterium]|nr:hypothetical protein [Desulfobacterales bacterium]